MRPARSVASGLAALALVAPPLPLIMGAALAQQSAPNAEACTNATWGYLWHANDEYGAVNICSYSIDVSFMASGGQPIRLTVAAGGMFRTGLKLPAFDRKKGWIATTCPAGYRPYPDVSMANWNAIVHEQYECRKTEAP